MKRDQRLLEARRNRDLAALENMRRLSTAEVHRNVKRCMRVGDGRETAGMDTP